MNWYNKLIKTANHGNTLNGEYLKQERERLLEAVNKMRGEAATGGPKEVAPRWKGDIRMKMLLLPSTDSIERMSMCELKDLSNRVLAINQDIDKYNLSRLKR